MAKKRLTLTAVNERLARLEGLNHAGVLNISEISDNKKATEELAVLVETLRQEEPPKFADLRACMSEGCAFPDEFDTVRVWRNKRRGFKTIRLRRQCTRCGAKEDETFDITTKRGRRAASKFFTGE